MFLLLGDHAGNSVPERLAGLGLYDADLERHIALDLGVAALGAWLATLLDAPFIEQRYSRLVIDCNRSPGSEGSILTISDGTPIPGNVGLSSDEREARRREIFDPYHRAIEDALSAREHGAAPAILVALHSFTPRMNGIDRPWQVGVLHGGGNGDFARKMLAILQATSGLAVGDNEPYRMDDTDYTVPAHAFASQRAYVELEIRQDELGDEAGVIRMAAILGKALREAASS